LQLIVLVSFSSSAGCLFGMGSLDVFFQAATRLCESFFSLPSLEPQPLSHSSGGNRLNRHLRPVAFLVRFRFRLRYCRSLRTLSRPEHLTTLSSLLWLRYAAFFRAVSTSWVSRATFFKDERRHTSRPLFPPQTLSWNVSRFPPVCVFCDFERSSSRACCRTLHS